MYKRKVAHFMTDDMKFTKTMANKFILMDEYDNKIFIVSHKSENDLDISFNNKVNLIKIDDFYQCLKQSYKDYDQIVFHSCFFIKNKYKIKMLVNRKIFKKIVWIEYGADLYNWKTNSILKNIINKKLLKSFKYIGYIFPQDIVYYKKNFKKNIISEYIAYTPNDNNIPLEEYYDGNKLIEKYKNNETIYIQVGHSSTPKLNHIEVLNELVKFKEENFKIVLFLSYGDMNYSEKVSEHALNLFGDKAIIIKDFLPREDFLKINSQIDIGIFKTNRQIALGNITPLIRKNKLVILPSECPMYKFYKENKVNVFSYEEFVQSKFEELIELEMLYNRDFLISFEDRKENAKRWINLLNMVSSKRE